MIKQTQYSINQTTKSLKETLAWAEKNKHSSLVPEYKIHAAALEKVLTECVLIEKETGEEAIQNACTLGARIREIKKELTAA